MKIYKIILPLVFIIFSSVFVFAAAEKKVYKNTADYFLQTPEKFLDKNATIKVKAISNPIKSPEEGYIAYPAYTVGPKEEDGGVIVVLIREARDKSFRKDFPKFNTWMERGGKVIFEKLSGKFIKIGNNYCIKTN